MYEVHSSFMLQLTPWRIFDISKLSLKKQVFSSIFVCGIFFVCSFHILRKELLKRTNSVSFCFLVGHIYNAPASTEYEKGHNK